MTEDRMLSCLRPEAILSITRTGHALARVTALIGHRSVRLGRHMCNERTNELLHAQSCNLCLIWLPQAAHGFTNSSKWASRVGAFVNLESTGPGGPDMAFQHAGDWTIQEYAAAAKHPRGSVVGQVHALHTGNQRIWHTFAYFAIMNQWATFCLKL